MQKREYVRKQREVDFIATRGSKKYYIQSAFSLTSQEAYFREKEAISKINDFNKKILVVRDPREYREDPSDNRGRQIIDYLIETKDNIGKMIIFDDNDDEISPLFPHEFVKINNFYGLNEDALNKAKEIISK